MKRPNYEELETRVKHLEKQNSLLLLFLYDTTGLRAPDAHSASPEGHYGGSLYRCTAADGGYVVIRSFGGEVPTIIYLDEIDTKWPAEIRILAERLRVERKKICDEEQEAAERINAPWKCEECGAEGNQHSPGCTQYPE